MQISIDLPWTRSKSAQLEVPAVEMPRVDLAAKVDDTKRVVSDSAETISAVAQDLGTQAASLGREAMKIGKDAARISLDAARKGQHLAANSGGTIRQLRSDAAATVDDLRSIRIVRESRRGPDFKPGVALLAGASAGLAAMFFLDPEQGRRRRVLFMDQAHKFARMAAEWFDGTTRDLRNKSQGWASEARKAADSMNRSQSTTSDAEAVAATPNVSNELAATDWSEPASTETEPSETYTRQN